ncbi:phosphopantetheine-binding protein [Micromonospora craniellae]|uniref:Carrier domain-containing protein n=1 Tax=Micromonospora craniellae TaxID=2294034 RepID=A0A372G6D2_9ACTN|nr:phosphopantetheine-binding protein [Micromonospora craniellae]QOC90129.1 hypothetical protein ID554_18185 [Micromonospora craniellae]RFS48484.1 hypothetical protein D0Q02_03160 [Micromonospora craniellae]
MANSLSRDRLRSDIAGILGEDPTTISDDENLIDRGLDSIRLLMLTTRWQNDGFDIGFLDLADEPTIAAWAELTR